MRRHPLILFHKYKACFSLGGHYARSKEFALFLLVLNESLQKRNKFRRVENRLNVTLQLEGLRLVRPTPFTQ